MTASGISHQSRLSESEGETIVQQKTEPIRIKLPRKRQQVKKTCPKERSKRERSVPVQQQQQETHEQVLGHRLKLDAALVHAGKLFDMLVDHDRLRDADEFSVFHKLSLRNIVLEKLTKELNARNVLPVTVMTLSKLFAQAFVAYKA